jgi:hypothetical protein
VSPTEEVGKVASTAIDALKGSPGLLVLVLLQLTTMAIVYFAIQHNQERQQEREITVLNRCFPPSHKKD